MSFVLRYEDPGPSCGTYFVGFKAPSYMPTFGGTRDEAWRFHTRAELAAAFGKHFAMGGCEVEEVD